MLEKDRLLILPWASSAGLPATDQAGVTSARRIQDPDSGNVLGFADWVMQSWWHGKTIRIFEVPDASLVATVRRPWGPLRMWRVSDAEERCMGSFHHQVLLDGMGYFLAQLEKEQTQRPTRFIARSGEELGTWEPQADGGDRITFAAAVNPFVRMNLLGAVIALPPWPDG